MMNINEMGSYRTKARQSGKHWTGSPLRHVPLFAAVAHGNCVPTAIWINCAAYIYYAWTGRFVNCFSLHPSVEHAERVIVSVNVKIHFGAMTSIDLNVWGSALDGRNWKSAKSDTPYIDGRYAWHRGSLNWRNLYANLTRRMGRYIGQAIGVFNLAISIHTMR